MDPRVCASATAPASPEDDEAGRASLIRRSGEGVRYFSKASLERRTTFVPGMDPRVSTSAVAPASP